MRIMTFNIQHGLHYPTGTIALERFSDLIREQSVDVCGLNEVRGKGADRDYTEQVETLGNALGFHRYFGEAIRVGGNNPYGSGVVSRYPFSRIETVPIPDPPQKTEKVYYETRCVIQATIEVEDHEICLLITHMGLAREERKNAVDTLLPADTSDSVSEKDDGDKDGLSVGAIIGIVAAVAVAAVVVILIVKKKK